MAVVPTRFDKETIKEIDELVKAGLYKNRSEAIKKLVTESLKRKRIRLLDDDLSALLEELIKKSKSGEQPFKILTGKTAADLVSEGRHRDETLH